MKRYCAFLLSRSRLVKFNKSIRHVRNCCDEDGMGNEFFISLRERKSIPPNNKITVVGVGQVGLACAIACISRKLTTNLCLFDANKEKMAGEALDLEHSSIFLDGLRTTAAENITETADSKLIIIAAGARQKEGEKRPALIGRNKDIFDSFLPGLVRNSPDAVFLVATNPCDAMTYVTWKMSKLPHNRILGSGTNLDSARFRYLIAKKLNTNPTDVQGYIIGEHGDSSVPVWSSVNISGVPLRSIIPDAGTKNEKGNWDKLHKQTVSAANDVIKLKGYTNWAIGFGVGTQAEAILKNTQHIIPITANLNGSYGIEDDIFASVPCVVGAGGIMGIIKIPLTTHELELLHKSAEVIKHMTDGVKL